MKSQVSSGEYVTLFHQDNFHIPDIYTQNRKVVLLTDEYIAGLYPAILRNYPTITIPSGEAHKTLESIAWIISELVALEADRNCLLIGLGGGVITDIAGLVASIYMRGIAVGYIPTTLLAMVDAAIGGKTGINLGVHKNMIGTFRQPEFILLDIHFLHTLSTHEWSNGFSEIIKYAFLFDENLISELEIHTLEYYRTNSDALIKVIDTCANWKLKTVTEDTLEKGNRKLLNFGHTIGHALETLYKLSHGEAVSIGMVLASRLSEKLIGFTYKDTEHLIHILSRYGLPVQTPFDAHLVASLIHSDKKRNNTHIDFILLKKPGEGIIHPVSLEELTQFLTEIRNC